MSNSDPLGAATFGAATDTLRHPLRLLSAWALALLPLTPAAQPVSLETGSERPTATVPSSTTATSPFGRQVVAIAFRPATLRPAELSLKVGQRLTSENLNAAMRELASHLTRHAELAAAASGGSAMSATYVDAQFELDPVGSTQGDTVAVTLRPLHVFLPLDDPGARILPIARGLTAASAQRKGPPPLLPARLTFASDRTLGPTIGSSWQFNPASVVDRNSPARFLRFRAGGMKSLDSSLYAGDAAMRGVRDWQTGLLRQVSAGIEASAAREPRGESRYDSATWSGTSGVALAFNANTRLLADARFASVRHRFIAPATNTPWSVTHELGGRAVFETIPPRWLGFFRAAVWQDTLSAGPAGTAQRLSARAGYAREIAVGVNQSAGLELIAGAGQTWGNLAQPRRFFAGGGQGQFLYESAGGPTLATMPDGPLLRSLGKAQGSLRSKPGTAIGGTSYWHLNLNVALPIPPWSRPLIPNEATDLPGPDGTPLTLKQLLRTQIAQTGPNLLQSTLETKDGLSPDEARRQAAQVFDQIRPAAHFVIDQANIFAVKPLLLIDAAGLAASPQHASWLAAGAGVQLTIVTAKFELGYMRTLSGPTYGSQGNVFARLGFERLF
ncbi:hypothetical protein [Horticoccus sp. 23ND18S-11]|uniref:hypothetical protein n=1 Tax=Horticoccus sp. 23ND18S-11 TaxID=3391832 RepID=UPI0039C9FA25